MHKLPFLAAIVFTSVGYGQTLSGDRITVPFSDAAKPRLVKVVLINGAVTVRGYEGKDVIVETQTDEKRRRVRSDGLRRIDVAAAGLSVEESGNVITVGARANRDAKLVMQVPVETSLHIRVTNGDDVIVENISGELDVHNTNGGIKLSNISGNVQAHALNDDVIVKLDKAAPNKPMSFSSLNGDIDVTLPADMKARLKMKSNQGEIYSDFDIQLEAASREPVVEDNRAKGGRYRVQFDRGFQGTINGGGPELQFTTLNGKILIRKAK